MNGYREDLDFGLLLSMRYLDNLREADPILALLVGGYAVWAPRPEERIVYFDFENLPAGVEYDLALRADKVLDAIAKRCLGRDWRAIVTVGVPA